ncbi:MAG: heavy-metal-associated domain-containing protein [Actinomycetota bacterium]
MTDTATRTYRVPDVSCQHCVDAINGEVGPLDGVDSVAVDIEAKTVTVVGGDDGAIRAAIDEAGYDVEPD